MMEGYIKLYRKLRENELWLEPRRFSKAEAWIDLLLRANHKDRDVVLGMETIHLKAGEFITSQLKLAEAWGWNRETVKIFLDLLQSSNQASYESSNKNTIVFIRKWGVYQGSNPATEPTTKRHQIQQQGDNRSSTINNDKNDNNVKNDKNNIYTDHNNDKSKSFSFESFWDLYPKQVGISMALLTFRATVKTEKDFEDLKAALKNYLASAEVKKGYIKNGSNWIEDWRGWIPKKAMPKLLSKAAAPAQERFTQPKPEDRAKLKALMAKIGKT